MHTLFRPGMRRLGTILALGLALCAAAGTGRAIADDPPGCGDSSGSGGNPVFWQGYEPLPNCPWYVSSEGIALQRLIRGLGPVATEGPGSTGTLALSQQDLADPFNAGVGLLVGHAFEESPYQVEASYFWMNPWNTSAQAIDPTGNLFSPFTNFGNPPDTKVDYDSLVQIHEVSRLEGGEANLKCKLPLPAGDPTIVLLFGVRHVALREEFDYMSWPTGNSNPVVVHSHTNNDLWGPQIGGVVECGHQDVWIRVEGKAAVCNNGANWDLDANVNGAETTHPRFFYSGTSMVGDIGASILWRPVAALTAKIGYQALWCDQVALAARNFAPDLATLTNPLLQSPMNARGTLIYHGPFAGLQWNW